MEYQIEVLKNVLDKDIPKLKKSGVDLKSLHRKLSSLKTNPYTTSKAKTGDLLGYRAVDFNKGYRLLFKVDEIEHKVTIISIDNHDEAYKKAKRRI